jgi:hypothetical protein
MKLTKTQEVVLEEMKMEINKAKKHNTFESYFENEVKPHYWADYIFKDYEMNAHKKRYDLALQNTVAKKANTKTFEKLSKLGLIEILKYDEFQQLDIIKVIN